MPEPAESDLLPYCPYCSYALEGLPIEHACPECGRGFDRRWRVFGGPSMYPNRAWWRKPGFALLVVIVPSLVIMGAMSIMLRASWPLLFPLVSAIGFGAVIARCPRGFIVLALEELRVNDGRGGWQSYPWTDVGRARYDLIHKSIAWDFRGEPVRHKVYWVFGVDNAAVDACVRAINAHPRPDPPTQAD